MRKWICILVLALTGAAVAQQPAGFGSAQAAAPQQKKEIKDPNEYTAYINATGEKDDNAKAAALEGFVQQYPNSVVKADALEQLLATYEKLNNITKLVDTANKLLQADPNSLRALALIAYLKRQQAASSTKPDEMQKTLADAAQYAERGLQAVQTTTKPEGMSDADFTKLKTETAGIFNGVVGFAALQNKDYGSAQTHLQAAVDNNPNNLADLYPLAISYLAGWPSPQVTSPPPTAALGIYYLARASSIAPDANQKASILKYAKSIYAKYHGDDANYPAWAPNTDYAAGAYVVGDVKAKTQAGVFPGATASPTPTAAAGATSFIEKATAAGKSGATNPSWCPDVHCTTQDGPVTWSNEGNSLNWDALTQLAAKTPKPPANFALKSRATPAEEAAAMAEKPVKDMGFDEFEFIFANGDEKTSAKVWDQIKDKPIAFEAKVQSATATKLTLSASAEDIEKNKSDVELTMVAPLKVVPKQGATIDVSGSPSSYTAKPFMITMTKGALIKQ